MMTTDQEITAWKSSAYDHFRYKTDVPHNVAEELTTACWENTVVACGGDVNAALESSPDDAVESELEYWSE